MSIEIDIKKFPEYPEISNLLQGLLDDNSLLNSKVLFLKAVLKSIIHLNSLGKTLKLDELATSSIKMIEEAE